MGNAFRLPGGCGGSGKKVITGVQPASAPEGTVWVNTILPIKGIEVLSDPIPSTAPAREGFLRIVDNHSGSFVWLDSKNTVATHFGYCSICRDGIWGPVDAMIYANGGWQKPQLKWFWEGAYDAALTGPWYGTYTLTGVAIRGSASKSGYDGPTYTHMAFLKKIDVTQYRKMHIRGYFVGGQDDRNIALGLNANSYTSWANFCFGAPGDAAVSALGNFSGSYFEGDADISALTGEYYAGVYFGGGRYQETSTYDVRQIWFD